VSGLVSGRDSGIVEDMSEPTEPTDGTVAGTPGKNPHPQDTPQGDSPFAGGTFGLGEQAELVERLSVALHDAYEDAAQAHGWITQETSRVPWRDVPEPCREATRAAVGAVLDALDGATVDGFGEDGIPAWLYWREKFLVADAERAHLEAEARELGRLRVMAADPDVPDPAVRMMVRTRVLTPRVLSDGDVLRGQEVQAILDRGQDRGQDREVAAEGRFTPHGRNPATLELGPGDLRKLRGDRCGGTLLLAGEHHSCQETAGHSGPCTSPGAVWFGLGGGE